MILDAAKHPGGDEGAIAVAEQNAALEADRLKHPRQDVEGFVVHEVDRARLARRAGIGRSRHVNKGKRQRLLLPQAAANARRPTQPSPHAA